MRIGNTFVRYGGFDRRPACVPGLLSVIVPIYNEVASLGTLLAKIDASPFEKEIVIVDDGSDDGTSETLRSVAAPHVTVIAHHRNYGKGAAIRTALEFVRGEFVIIQDGDLEYDPADYSRLLKPLQAGLCDVVYGIRPDRPERGYRFHWGAKCLTWTTNALYRSHLHDEATCYKAFRRTLLDQLALTCVRFEFCPEVTAKLLRLGYSIAEVPISYHPRRRGEGKKVTVADGWRAVLTLLHIRCMPQWKLTRMRPATAASLFSRTVLATGRLPIDGATTAAGAPRHSYETRHDCGVLSPRRSES